MNFISKQCAVAGNIGAYTVCQKKNCASVIFWTTPWNILADFNNFCKQHHEEAWRKWLRFCPPHTIVTLPCEIQNS